MLTCTDLVITIDWISAVDVEEVATIEGMTCMLTFFSTGRAYYFVVLDPIPPFGQLFHRS